MTDPPSSQKNIIHQTSRDAKLAHNTQSIFIGVIFCWWAYRKLIREGNEFDSIFAITNVGARWETQMLDEYVS